MDRERAAQVANAYPMLLIGTADPIRQLGPLVKFFREELGVDPGSEVCVGFYAWPDSLDTIEPTFRYLLQDCGFSLEQLCKDPTLLAYSLDARVKPRALFAGKNGLPM